MIPNAVGPPFAADGDAAEGDYVLAVATLEPRKNLPRLVEGFRRAGLNGCELRVAGDARLGRRAASSGDGVRWLGERRATRSSRGSTAARAASPTSRSTRASGCPCSRRWPAARRSSPAGTGRAEEVAGRRGRARRPARPGRDRRRAAPRRSTGATSCASAASSGRARSTGSEVARADRRGLPRGRRVSAPLVVIDADVLGRQRTGDETYVDRPPARARAGVSDLRFAAVTRRPDLVPDGIEPVELPARSQVCAHGVSAAPAPAPPRPRARALPARAPAPLPVPRRRDRPRPLVRARPAADGRARPARSSGRPFRAPPGAPTACWPSPSARSAT